MTGSSILRAGNCAVLYGMAIRVRPEPPESGPRVMALAADFPVCFILSRGVAVNRIRV